MADVIDFETAKRLRQERNEPQPDPGFVVVDTNGVKWYLFTCSFVDGDATCSFDLFARDLDDAKRRLALIGSTGKVDGKMFNIIPFE